MVATTHITITCANLDSGNAVKFLGTNIMPSYKKIIEANPITGTQTAKLPEGQDIGIDVPIWTFQGVIDTRLFTTSALWALSPSTTAMSLDNGSTATGYMTLGYLLALWRSMGNEMTIQVPFGDPDDQHYWRNWDGTSSTIKVILDSISPTPDASTEGSHFVNVTLVFREVVANGIYLGV